MLLPTLTLALLGTLALGFWVFAAAPGRRENQVFAGFTWLTSLWVANDLAFWGFHGPDTDGMTWARVAFVISMGLQLAFVAFAWVFPRPRPLRPGWAAALLAPLPFLIGVAVWGQPLGSAGFREGTFHLTTTPWTFVLGGYVYAVFFLGRLVVAPQRRREEQDPDLRRQLDLVLLSPTLTGAVTTAMIVVLPLLGIYELLPYASVGILLGALVHSYAAFNLRFLRPTSALDDLRLFPVTAKLGLAVAAFWLVTVVLLLGIVQTTAQGDPSPQAWQRAWVFGLVGASLPAMALILAAQRIVSRPLRKIGEVAVGVARGRTDLRVDLPSTGREDEVSLLASSFNSMVDRLEDDLRTQQETSETLRRTERLAVAGSLAAGVAHEVNNPLAAISSLVQTARGKTDDEQAKALLQDALGHMDRISGALRDLLDFARAPAQPQRRACRLEVVVERTVRLLRHDKRFRRVDLQVSLAEGLPAVSADADQLQQVLLNLILNSRDALEARDPPGGDARIAVATRAQEGEVALSVSDTGCGIPAEERERLFEPFFTTKPAGSGTGLGLAVCKDLVRMHDGRIEVESEVGEGTTITVVLPALEEHRAQVSA